MKGGEKIDPELCGVALCMLWNLTAITMADTSMPSSGAGGWRRKSE